jgi:hypothetical protein
VPHAGWLFLLVFVACAPPRRAEFSAPIGRCKETYRGEQAQACVARDIARTAREDPGRAFDELSAFIDHEYPPQLKPSPELEGLLLFLGPAVQAEAADLYATGKMAPAQHRSERLCAAWRHGSVCPFRKELERLDSVATAKHLRAADELSRSWPLASLLHACLASPEDDACKEAASVVRDNRPGVALELDVDKSCRAVFGAAAQEQLIAEVAPEGGPALGSFRLQLASCEPVKPSDNVRSDVCHYDLQSQARDGRRDPGNAPQQGKEVARVATMARGFRIHAILRAADGNAISRKAGLVDGSRHPIDVEQVVIGRQTRTSAHCKLEEVTIGERAAAAHALRIAVDVLTDRVASLTMSRKLASVEVLWADAFVNRRTAEAEHWAVMSYLMQRKDFPDTGGARWLVERYGWTVGRGAQHRSDFPALSRRR